MGRKRKVDPPSDDDSEAKKNVKDNEVNDENEDDDGDDGDEIKTKKKNPKKRGPKKRLSNKKDNYLTPEEIEFLKEFEKIDNEEGLSPTPTVIIPDPSEKK